MDHRGTRVGRACDARGDAQRSAALRARDGLKNGPGAGARRRCRSGAARVGGCVRVGMRARARAPGRLNECGGA